MPTRWTIFFLFKFFKPLERLDKYSLYYLNYSNIFFVLYINVCLKSNLNFLFFFFQMTTTLAAANLKNDFFLEDWKKSNLPKPYQAQQQQQQHSLSRRYEQLLTTEKYCDCVFVLGSSEQVKCHKLILATASPVFEAMFYGPISEIGSCIEILDMSLDIFQLMILYIYKGSIDFHQLTLEETIELYYGAEKYLLSELKTECLENIQLKLRFSNILASLDLSICLDLSSLLNICINFFTRCCLCEAQFAAYLKKHYYHVSKECVKTIINFCKEQIPTPNLLWFIYEWCQQECIEMGLKSSDCSAIIEDLNLDTPVTCAETDLKQPPQFVQTIERFYYKACRPFNVDYDNCIWLTCVKADRFISLQGLTLSSRLTPHLARPQAPTDYLENLSIEITASSNDNNLKWCHEVSKQLTKYNCDLNIKWANGLVLSPDIEYQIKIIWRPDQSQGAEYPCSLFSSQIDGIQFRELDTHSGSLIKGLHFVNLV